MAILNGSQSPTFKPMFDPVAVRRGPGHTSQIGLSPFGLLLALLVIMGGALAGGWSPAWAAEPNPESPPAVAAGTQLDFNKCVDIAIRQSPYFTKSELNIDIRKMDESDSRYAMVPPLTFRTYYYVNRPSGIGGEPYSLNFTTDPYNPLGAYFTLQAQKLATQVAVLTHLKNISEGLESLGDLYLRLYAFKKLAEYQREVIKLAREKLHYVDNRQSIGSATALEIKVAEKELQLALGEQESILLSQKQVIHNIKNFLNLPANHKLNFDLHNCRQQVLGDFSPETASLERAKLLSYDLKALAIHQRLQGYNISLAIAKVFPTILFNTQTPDPLSVTSSHGLYVGFGLEIPVWDGLKRVRNVSRQKAVLQQIKAMTRTKEGTLGKKWYDELVKIQDILVSLNSAKKMVELTQLKAHQKEISYQSGETQLPVVLEGRHDVLAAQKQVIRKSLLYDQEILKLREISGDLGNTYVRASKWLD
jgi:outer membrane protein TolC